MIAKQALFRHACIGHVLLIPSLKDLVSVANMTIVRGERGEMLSHTFGLGEAVFTLLFNRISTSIT